MAGKVLIIDDEPDILLVLKARLEAAQYQVVTTQNGYEALEKFKAEKPDLIVTDVMMPGMTGYEFFEALRGLGGEASLVPVIVMSARGSMGQLFDKWAIRCFMPKPLDMPAFLREVEAAIASRAVQEKGLHRKPGETGKVLMAGVSEYEMRNMSQFLESRGFIVLQALDERDAAKAARKEWPNFILFEYWEDDARFDSLALFRFLTASPDTKNIPCAVFCNAALRLDAARHFTNKNILGFTSVKDLLQKLEVLLRLPEFKRSGP